MLVLVPDALPPPARVPVLPTSHLPTPACPPMPQGDHSLMLLGPVLFVVFDVFLLISVAALAIAQVRQRCLFVWQPVARWAWSEEAMVGSCSPGWRRWPLHRRSAAPPVFPREARSRLCSMGSWWHALPSRASLMIQVCTCYHLPCRRAKWRATSQQTSWPTGTGGLLLHAVCT